MRNYPNKEKVKAHLVEEDKQIKGKEQELVAYVNELRQLNTLSIVSIMDVEEDVSGTLPMLMFLTQQMIFLMPTMV